MNNAKLVTSAVRWTLVSVGLAVALGMTVYPSKAWALVDCTNPGTSDTDGDGFTDVQECTGITTLGTIANDGTVIPGRVFPRCLQGSNRQSCVDPDSKDLFVLYVPTAVGLLNGTLGISVPDPFAPDLTAYGLIFNSFTTLGLTVHKLDPGQIPLDTRLVTNGSLQKAVAVFEDLDATDIVLGYCQYGTPNRVDGGACTVYTQRIWDYISSTCAGLTPFTAAGVQTSLEEVFKAYVIQTILHEVGHSSGGMTAKFVSNYNGYHYAPNTTVMEQYVVATARDTTCKFSIHKDWNVTNDKRSIRLK